MDSLEGYPGTEQQLTAWIEWRDAEQAYQDMSSRFVAAWWEKLVLYFPTAAFGRLRRSELLRELRGGDPNKAGCLSRDPLIREREGPRTSPRVYGPSFHYTQPQSRKRPRRETVGAFLVSCYAGSDLATANPMVRPRSVEGKT